MRTASALLFTWLVLTPTASAQIDFDFVSAPGQSDFTWSGTVTTAQGANLPVVGNPTNAFELVGDQRMSLTSSASQSVASGAFTSGGDLLVTPDLRGRVYLFVIPIYDVECIDVHLSASTASFTVAPNGAFSTTVTLTILSGTMQIDPVGAGLPSMLDLTGYLSDPTNESGTLTQVGGNLRLSLPITATFHFDYPPNSGTIDIAGTLVADWLLPAATTYCTAKTNSLGCVPAIAAVGVPSYSSASPFVVSASNVVNNKNGLVFYGYTPSSAPFQGGTKCVAPPTLRSPVQSSNGSPSGDDCSGTFAYDFGPLIQSHSDALLVPGREVFGQYWSRDPQASFNTNLTDALGFTIAP